MRDYVFRSAAILTEADRFIMDRITPDGNIIMDIKQVIDSITNTTHIRVTWWIHKDADNLFLTAIDPPYITRQVNGKYVIYESQVFNGFSEFSLNSNIIVSDVENWLNNGAQFNGPVESVTLFHNDVHRFQIDEIKVWGVDISTEGVSRRQTADIPPSLDLPF